MKPCPNSVIAYGTLSMEVRRKLKRLQPQLLELISLMEKTVPDVEGARVMELGVARNHILDAMKALGSVEAAHDYLRDRLVSHGYCEPTDDQIKGGGGR
jgi:hypothetical protein